MTNIKDFGVYRTVRFLRVHSQKAGDTARKIRAFMDTIGTVKEVLIENKKMMEKIDATLDANQDRVEKTINFTRKCEEAMEFGDISKMTICYRHLAKRKQQS